MTLLKMITATNIHGRKEILNILTFLFEEDVTFFIMNFKNQGKQINVTKRLQFKNIFTVSGKLSNVYFVFAKI